MDTKIKVVCAFGTRPEAIKMCPLYTALCGDERFDTKLLVSAQHRELLDSVLAIFGAVPDCDLNIFVPGQSLSDIISRTLSKAVEYLTREKPDMLLVHGDTSTTFAMSLAGFYAGVPVGHVEAGLRTFNKREPYPEELNRLLVGRIADVHFAPTRQAKQNLLNENVPGDEVYVTGNTEIDAISQILSKTGEYRYNREALNTFDRRGRLIVMTAHRRENLGKPMEEICRAVLRVVCENEDVSLIWAVHPNPDVQSVARRVLGGHERVLLTDAVDVCDMYHLAAEAHMLATESAALQEISAFLDKPCVVLRNVTERPEGVATGALLLGGNSFDSVYESISKVLGDKAFYAKMAAAENPFGDGRASGRIVSGILHYFKQIPEKPEDF